MLNCLGFCSFIYLQVGFIPNYGLAYFVWIYISLFSELRAFKVKSTKIIQVYVSIKDLYSPLYYIKNKTPLQANNSLFYHSKFSFIYTNIFLSVVISSI